MTCSYVTANSDWSLFLSYTASLPIYDTRLIVIDQFYGSCLTTGEVWRKFFCFCVFFLFVFFWSMLMDTPRVTARM